MTLWLISLKIDLILAYSWTIEISRILHKSFAITWGKSGSHNFSANTDYQLIYAKGTLHNSQGGPITVKCLQGCPGGVKHCLTQPAENRNWHNVCTCTCVNFAFFLYIRSCSITFSVFRYHVYSGVGLWSLSFLYAVYYCYCGVSGFIVGGLVGGSIVADIYGN